MIKSYGAIMTQIQETTFCLFPVNINIYQPVYIHRSFHSHRSPTEKILCFSIFYTNFPKESGLVNKLWRLVATPAVSCPRLLMLRHSTSLTCFPVFTGRNREALCVCVCVCVCELLSHVQLFVTSWTEARQAPLSMKFSR